MKIESENYPTSQSFPPSHSPQLLAGNVPVAKGTVDHASWLSDDVLLIVGWFPAEDVHTSEAFLVSGDQCYSVDVRYLPYPRLDIPGAGPRAGKLLTAHFSNPESLSGPLGNLVVRIGSIILTLASSDLWPAVVGLQSLLRSDLAGLEPETRAEVMEFLASTLTYGLGTKSRLQLSKNLFISREALRERLPYCVVSRDQPQGLGIDAIMAIDERSFFITGWAWDQEAEIVQLEAISPEGSRVELSHRVFRYHRSDIEELYGVPPNNQSFVEPGFISYFELGAPSCLSTGWTVQMQNTIGMAVEVTAPSVIRDMVTVRNRVLADLAHERPPGQNLMLNHTFPAISRLQERLEQRVEIHRIDQCGIPNESPHVSIIVPLYEGSDFLEHQLAQFALDPELRQADLIYLLDSPESAEELWDFAVQLFLLYHIPFRMVTLKANVGFASANIGASLARGRLLLLLDPNVLPDSPGWLGMMTAFYESTPGIGALGPKLLYEDNSLQHAGIYFSGRAGWSVWENQHYFRGLHRHLPEANALRPVPAVTDACLMIHCELYQGIGGLANSYVQRGCQGSDLCLRLIRAGYQNWYLPDVELYQLEAQSPPDTLRELALRYNTWVQTRLRNEHIEAVMARYTSSSMDKAVSKINGRY